MSEMGWRPQHSDLDHIIETAWAWKMRGHAGALPAEAARKL
jgi:UDP-glucose 4-epimerase